MMVVETRKQRGIHDAQGQAPDRTIPKGDALLQQALPIKQSWQELLSRARCSTSHLRPMNTSKPISLEIFSSVTTLIGKAVNSQPWGCCLRFRGLIRNWSPT
jgi:hypothetical protein